MLKVGFAYLGAFEAVYIRNGVVRDMREQIYSKIIKLAFLSFLKKEKAISLHELPVMLLKWKIQLCHR